MYAMVCTMHDLAYAVRVVRRFMSNPGESHWAAIKWILRYLRDTSKCVYVLEMVILYCMAIQDADYARDKDSRKSTLGYLMTFAVGAVS